MKRRYGLLALAVLSLLLLNLGWQYEPPQTPADAQVSLRGVRQPQQAPAPPVTALMTRLTPAASGSQPTDPHPSWREMPQEMSQLLASEVGDSEQPLAERLANLSELESQWMSEGESLTRLQGRYAEALAQLASEGEQLTLAERLAALTRPSKFKLIFLENFLTEGGKISTWSHSKFNSLQKRFFVFFSVWLRFDSVSI